MIALLLSGLIMLIIALLMLCRLLKHENAALNITVPHKTLLNGTVEIELQDLSVLWMDRAKQITIPQSTPAPTKQESCKETIEWYENDDFIQFLKNCINDNLNLCSGSNFSAFSLNGIVYLTPSALWSYVTLYIKTKDIVHKSNNKQKIMLLIVETLIKHGLIKADEISKGSYTAAYLITTSKKDTKLKPKSIYIPLIAEHFNTDKKKEGILTFITNVELYKEVSDAE